MICRIDGPGIFQNKESPFTEIFSLLKYYECSPGEVGTLAYSADELKIMNQHIDNAMNVLIQGLQVIGNLMGMLPPDQVRVDTNYVGLFIAVISNLTEELNNLKTDTDFALRKCEI